MIWEMGMQSTSSTGLAGNWLHEPITSGLTICTGWESEEPELGIKLRIEWAYWPPSYRWSTTNVLLLIKKIMKMICHVGYLLKHYHSNMCFNMDGPWVHCAKWNKLVTKRHVLYNPSCLRYLEWSHLRKQKREWWFPGTEDRRKCRAASRHRGWALQDEKFQRLVAYQFLNGLTSSEWFAERWSKLEKCGATMKITVGT